MRFTAATSIWKLQFFILILNGSCSNVPFNYKYVSGIIDSIGEVIQEMIRPCISRGFPEFGIPILDPLRLDEIHIETNNSKIGKLNITLYNSTIRGLNRFVIDRLTLSMIAPTIAVNLTVPELYIYGEYNLVADIGTMYHVYGTGPLKANASNFRVFLKTSLEISDPMKLINLKIDFSYDKMDVHFDNFMNGSESGIVMSEVLKQNLPQAIEILKPEILPRLENFIVSGINNIIHQFTGNILNLLKSLKPY